MLTFKKFSRANLKRCASPKGFNHKLDKWSTSDWFVAIMGELGEAANVAKKLNRIRDDIRGNRDTETVAELRAKLENELMDAWIYLDLISQSLGIDPEKAITRVFNNKSAEIGYPDRLS